MAVTTYSKIREIVATDIYGKGDRVIISPSTQTPGAVRFETHEANNPNNLIVVSREDVPELIAGLQKIYGEYESA